MSSIEETGVVRVIDALKDVTCLDLVQAVFVSNEQVDAQSPVMQRFVFDLLAAERRRREADDDEEGVTDYPAIDFRDLPLNDLVGAAAFAIGAMELCVMSKPFLPTVIHFAKQVQGMLLTCLAYRLYQAELDLASMRSQNN